MFKLLILTIFPFFQSVVGQNQQNYYDNGLQRYDILANYGFLFIGCENVYENSCTVELETPGYYGTAQGCPFRVENTLNNGTIVRSYECSQVQQIFDFYNDMMSKGWRCYIFTSD